MKKKLHITERNFINLIKKIVLEQQTPEELAAQYGRDVNLNLLPNYATAAAQQPAAQPAAQRQVACPTGYRQKEKGPYVLCDQSTAIQRLQKQFKITQDGKLGPNTLYYIRYFLQDKNKINVSDDEINTFIKQSTSDAVGATSGETTNQNTTQTNNINNSGVVVNISANYGGDVGYVNKSFMKGGYIQLTDSAGRTRVTTSCESLKTKKGIRYVVKGNGYEKKPITIDDKLYNILNYNFCSKNVTNVNVTNLIISELKALPTDNNRFTGQSFRAVKDDATNSIYIKNEKGATILYTNCNSLSKNNFYRNYGALNLPKGSMVALTQLSGAIKSSFCNTTAKA
jgi:hypothetical protein